MLLVGNRLVDQQSPAVLTLSDRFRGSQFFHWGGGRGAGRAWFQDDSSALHLSCTNF